MDIIKSYKEISISWLQNILSKGKYINENINRFDLIETFNTPASEISRVKINFDKSEYQKASINLFIKISSIGKKEANFYNNIIKHMNKANLLFCYHAYYDENTNLSNLIFDDVSDTHFNSEWPLPPPMRCFDLAVDCLADLHATWWEHEDLEKITGKFFNEKTLRKQIAEFWESVENFLIFMGDRLGEERKSIILNIYENAEHLFGRYFLNNPVTLIRNDNHIWNYLFPKNDDDNTLMIDWQGWDYGMGIQDLVYLIVMQLYPNVRTYFPQVKKSLYCHFLQCV